MTSAVTRGRPAGVAVARQIAERFDLPFIDLRATGVVRAAADVIEARTLVRAVGTRGYRGRVGIFQILTMTDEVSRLAAREATAHEIEAAASADGMRSLWDDGVDKVVAGLTTVDELRRILI